MSVDGVGAEGDEPIDILILGPMGSGGDDVIPRTERLKRIVEVISEEIKLEYSQQRFSVKSPEDLGGRLIIPGVLRLIEAAELVVIDLAKNSPSVAYEVAIVQALGTPNILVADENSPPPFTLEVASMLETLRSKAKGISVLPRTLTQSFILN